MIKSMTGFGRFEASEGERKMTVEIKSVNHRYLDLTLKMPKKLNCFDSAARALLKEYVERGKVDVSIAFEDLSGSSAPLACNLKLVAQYLEHFCQLKEQFGLKDDVTVSTFVRCPDVFVVEEQQEASEELWQLLERALRGACGRFVEARAREGEALRRDMEAKLDELQRLVDFIEERSPGIVAEYQQKLRAKVRELLSDTQMDDSRIVQEVTIFADKVCIDEEIVRLKSHIQATRAALKAGGSVGRKLDFIAQEMNREANTTLSKANDLEIVDRAIALKANIEKIREQIQNIE